ncbi:hypothetical protein D3C81_2239060 [compost metagenome]
MIALGKRLLQFCEGSGDGAFLPPYRDDQDGADQQPEEGENAENFHGVFLGMAARRGAV